MNTWNNIFLDICLFTQSRHNNFTAKVSLRLLDFSNHSPISSDHSPPPSFLVAYVVNCMIFDHTSGKCLVFKLCMSTTGWFSIFANSYFRWWNIAEIYTVKLHNRSFSFPSPLSPKASLGTCGEAEVWGSKPKSLKKGFQFFHRKITGGPEEPRPQFVLLVSLVN